MEQPYITARHCENLEALSEGTVYKKEDRRVRLSSGTDEVTEEQLNQSLMASLLEYQNSEAERLIRSLAGKVGDHMCITPVVIAVYMVGAHVYITPVVKALFMVGGHM